VGVYDCILKKGVKVIKKVVVIGGGTMGNGIAQVCAQAGIKTVLIDVSKEILETALKKIRHSVNKLIEKKKIALSHDEVLGNITITENYENVENADMVIEAAFEKWEVKKRIFEKIDSIVGPTTVLASNTSAIPISQIASATSHPENVIGLHFFNPVPLMKAVEVIRGTSTSEEVFRYGESFVKIIDKEAILVQRDISGFILNRINMLTNMEAYRLVEQGVAKPEDIDKGVRLAFGRKMGPFETSDMVGIDVQLMAYMNVFDEERDLRFYPPSIMRQKVLAGHLGKKTGKGWYEYNEDGTKKAS
jgi:3-hydroxybutyryl-CoA dehydrogenase